MKVISKSEAEAVWVVRDLVRFLGEVPAPGFALVEVVVPPGSGTPPHRHASPEIFHVAEGEITIGTFEAGPPQFTKAKACDSVSIASNVTHNYQNNGQTPARMLVVVDEQMSAFFRDAGTTAEPPMAPPSEAEIAKVIAACKRHGIEMLPMAA